MYCVFAVDELLFSLADPRDKFIGYLFKFLFINCLIISSVVINIDVSLDLGLNFGDHMRNVFEIFFLLFWNITCLGEGGVGFVLGFFLTAYLFSIVFFSFNLQKCSDISTPPDLPNKYLKLCKLI